jgi:HlyD family secretion protein
MEQLSNVNSLTPSAKIRVGSVVLGTVAKVTAEEGDEVEQGRVLVGLDDAEARALVSQARASVGQAEAKLAQVGGVGARVALEAVKQASSKLEQARVDLEREKVLQTSGASTIERVDTAQKSFDIAVSAKVSALAQASGSGPGGGDYQAAVSSVAQSRAALEAAEARLAQTRILAPSDCIVLQRSVEPGDVVQSGRVLMVLARKGVTGLTVQVDEKNLALIRVGQTALGSADAFALEKFGAKVTFIAPAVDASKGTVEVKLQVDNPPAFLRSDMTVSVNIDGGTRDNVLMIPLNAVRDGSSMTPYVFVLSNDLVERRLIQVGLRAGEKVEVTGGLQNGESVVTATVKPLAQGQKVRPRVLQADEASRAL